MEATRKRSTKPAQRTLLIGGAGGVASACLALLDQDALGHSLLEGTSALFLLDRDRPRLELPERVAARATWLPAQSLDDKDQLSALLVEHRISEVIELAEVGTWDCVEACAEQGASFLTTCFDLWPVDDERPARGPQVQSMLRARELFEPPDIAAGVHLIGAGMNPGLVNSLVAAGLRAFAERVGCAPSLRELELHSILFTEIDATIELDPRKGDRFAATWNPEGCLEELLEPVAMIVRGGELVALDHRPHRAEYAARCGGETIIGHLVPHEELVTLGAMYPTVELGYVYRLPEVSRAALAEHPERPVDEWLVRRLYPPFCDQLDGFDRIGALLCSHRFGELWIGWQTELSQARRYGTNATLLQVAAGVLAGWSSLRTLEPGVWLPEELDSRQVLARASSLLGEPKIVWDPDAPVRTITQRRV